MSDIMAQLKADHVNVARLLDILEKQMDTVHDEEHADFELMHDIMTYMSHYPDTTHHPMEDLVFERLVHLDASAKGISDRLAREHKGLSEKGNRFLDMLRHVVDGSLVERKELEAQGRDFIDFLRSHMEYEDTEAFPRAEDSLGEEDWAAVAAGMKARTDPVFGPVVAEDFRSLYDYIQRESA